MIYFLFGAVSLLAQVILIRRLLSVFCGNELTIGALFSGWMFWTGIGGFLFSRLSDRSLRPRSAFALLIFLGALLFILSAGATWLLRYIFRFNPAMMPGLGIILPAGFLISGPSCILLGAGFNYSARMFGAGEKSLVRLYLWEALGSAIIGMVFSFGMAGRVSAFTQIALCGFLISACGALALEGRRRYLALGLSAIIFGGLLIFSARIETTLIQARWKGQEVVLEQESKYAVISITRSEGQINFWLDGLPAFSYPNPELFEQMIQIPLAMCEKPEKVLLIGGGLLPALNEIFKHPVKEIVYLQIDPVLTGLEAKYLPGYERIEKDPRLRIIHQDARFFLSRTEEQFDAIILNLPDPETANLNRYYTLDFFELARQRLNPAGVLGFGIGISGNYLSDAEGSLLANSLVSLEAVFPKIALLPLGRNYLVAGEDSRWLTEDPDQIVAVLKQRGVETRFVREYYLKDNLSAERVSFIKASVKRFRDQPANTDLRPRGYYLSALLWLEQANPAWRGYVRKIFEIGKLPLWLGLSGYLILALALVRRRGPRALAGISIFSIGFAGISAELVLMLGFQVRYGYVYHLIGILISGFMAGLSLGAYLYQRLQDQFNCRPISGLILMVFAEALAMLVCVAGLRILNNYPMAGWLTLAAILLLLILVAVFSGICFPLSAHLLMKHSRPGIGFAAGWINAWDHLGSSLGAFVTSVFLIPLFGLEFALWFFALLILAGLLSAFSLFRAG